MYIIIWWDRRKRYQWSLMKYSPQGLDLYFQVATAYPRLTGVSLRGVDAGSRARGVEVMVHRLARPDWMLSAAEFGRWMSRLRSCPCPTACNMGVSSALWIYLQDEVRYETLESWSKDITSVPGASQSARCADMQHI